MGNRSLKYNDVATIHFLALIFLSGKSKVTISILVLFNLMLLLIYFYLITREIGAQFLNRLNTMHIFIN